jgi:hypothetical protein
MKTDQS